LIGFGVHVKSYTKWGPSVAAPDHQQDRQSPFLRKAGLYLGVAFELPATIIGGLVVGYFLDRYFQTSPWLLIILTAVSFIGAFVRLVHWVRFFTRRDHGGGKQ
jgi:F0F1-type ATP synthase assembly protein I